MSSIKKFKFSHPLLGELHGRLCIDGVVQFRGIPFARIPGRFRQAALADQLLPEERDCTHYSYVCPQQPPEYEAFGGRLPEDFHYRHDELRCLNLTVSVPRAVLEGISEKPAVPVMVYVHGGGFARGANVGGINGGNTIYREILLAATC